MDRRAFLGVSVALPVSGCLAWFREGRECPELENLGGERICSSGGSLSLEIESDQVTVPTEVTFTVVNDRDRAFEFHRAYPLVYRKEGSDWREDRYYRWRWPTDVVTVEDRYSYDEELPFWSSDPEPGEYLIFVTGWDDPDRGERLIHLGDLVEIET